MNSCQISSGRPALRRPALIDPAHNKFDPLSPSASHPHRSPYFAASSRPGPRFFLSGGVTRTSSSARISPDPSRSVPSTPELRRTPAQQGFAAFVTASATSGGTR
ncbi:hypothetical protein DF047_20105 [Burkholderia cenocepacia]|nr:hypothetical protein DF047_20105 [Burkholderia cenocepacia]